MANATKKSIAIFVINDDATLKTQVQEIDLENGVSDSNQVKVNESNLHEKIFGRISKKAHLITQIHTSVNVIKSVAKTTIQRENVTLNNLGSASTYLSNFLAENGTLQ